MTTQRKWLWAGGIVAAAAALLALGVPPLTLLLIALILGCPAAMYFGRGMGGKVMGSESTPDKVQEHLDLPGAKPKVEDLEQKRRKAS